jgi:hypothetical protein
VFGDPKVFVSRPDEIDDDIPAINDVVRTIQRKCELFCYVISFQAKPRNYPWNCPIYYLPL